MLNEALHNQAMPTPLTQPHDLVADVRDSVPGSPNNDGFPLLFLFLLNHFSKAVIAQLAEEAGVKPHMAASIGIVTVKIFSKPEYHWRGYSMIDILMAKYRVVCPALFSVRGTDTTENGKRRLGWKKINGQYIHADAHAQRMIGFGAGFAAICLRDFSRSAKLKHPYAVANYWQAMASIVATPQQHISRTQCYVLKAMIDDYEEKFLGFYGAAALAALQVATVHFPARLAVQNEASAILSAMPAKMKLQLGVDVLADAFRV